MKLKDLSIADLIALINREENVKITFSAYPTLFNNACVKLKGLTHHLEARLSNLDYDDISL